MHARSSTVHCLTKYWKFGRRAAQSSKRTGTNVGRSASILPTRSGSTVVRIAPSKPRVFSLFGDPMVVDRHVEVLISGLRPTTLPKLERDFE